MNVSSNFRCVPRNTALQAIDTDLLIQRTRHHAALLLTHADTAKGTLTKQYYAYCTAGTKRLSCAAVTTTLQASKLTLHKHERTTTAVVAVALLT
jgi:hypothetical protein